MEEQTKERIRLLLKENDLSFNAISETSAIQAQFSRAFGKGKSARLSYDLIEIVLNKIPDASAEWLLRGEGDMYKKTTELPPVDVSSDESIEHSAEVARLVKEKNALAEENQALREENDRLQAEYNKAIAQLDYASALLRDSLRVEPHKKFG